jgi:hypothetical protein
VLKQFVRAGIAVAISMFALAVAFNAAPTAKHDTSAMGVKLICWTNSNTGQQQCKTVVIGG